MKIAKPRQWTRTASHPLLAGLFLTVVLLSPRAHAQGAAGSSALTALEQNVQKTTSAWQVLARDLDARIARMLPCDPRAKAAIDEITRASTARLAAQSEYYQTAQTLASTRTEGARKLLATEQARAADLKAEQEQASQAIPAFEQQMASLGESARQQTALAPAQNALRQSAATAQQRAATAQSTVDRETAVLAMLADLVKAYQVREAALKDRITAFAAERGRWNGYYAARLARAQTECSITLGTPATPARPAAAKAPAKGKPK